jgi:hypothetical protein
VTAVSAGTIYPGTIVAGTGVVTGTRVTSQISGTPQGAGVYTVTPSQQKSIASGSITGSYGVFTVLGTVTGTYTVGQTLTGGTTSAGTFITYPLTGTGGLNSTFVVTPSQTVAAAAINAVGNVETKWYAASAAPAGGLVKITSWVGAQG